MSHNPPPTREASRGPGLSLLVLKTRRLAELRAFYAALGIEFVEERHGRGPLHYAGRLGDVIFEVYPLPGESVLADGAARPASPADAPSIRLGLIVDRLAETLALLRGLPGVVVGEPKTTEWGASVLVRDPDGRPVELSAR
ncbi:MAG TPA: hypothetical protein VGE52_17460 [Pirellulales bacterium]